MAGLMIRMDGSGGSGGSGGGCGGGGCFLAVDDAMDASWQGRRRLGGLDPDSDNSLEITRSILLAQTRRRYDIYTGVHVQVQHG